MNPKVIPLFADAGKSLKEKAQLVGRPYQAVSVINYPGAPAMAAGYPLQQLGHPSLIRTFLRWMEIAGPRGVFRLGVDGTEETIWTEPDIKQPRTMMVIVDDGPPAEWYFARHTPGFAYYSHERFKPRQVKDMPAPSIVDAICADYEKLLRYGRPAVSRISGIGPTGFTAYDRLWLPLVEPGSDTICRFVTSSHVLEPLKV